MINRQELRPMNRVKLSNGQLVPVVGMFEEYVMIQHRATPIPYSQIYPIPLNGHNLVRMGWKVNKPMRKWKHEGCKFTLYEMNGKYGFATEGIEGELHFFLFCEYVHELQNQFYILTKQNLPWKRLKRTTKKDPKE